MLYDSIQIKLALRELGADLCGIASPNSFKNAPPGCKPSDIYKKCKSVIVFAKRMLKESVTTDNSMPYTHTFNITIRQVDEIGMELCYILEDMGIHALPVPSDDPYEFRELQNPCDRTIISLRRAAYYAGLGVITKNGLLTNMKLGNIIHIGAVLANAQLEADKPAEYSICPEDCRLCIDACPAKALDGGIVNNELCRPVSCHISEKGYISKKCNLCMAVCPNYAGIAQQYI